MKINYEKIKGKAILPLDSYNLHEIIMSFVHNNKLNITYEEIHSDDKKAYDTWCHFLDKVRSKQHDLRRSFAIALDPSVSEGCVYGDIKILKELGYEEISLTDALEELPNMSQILGVTPNETLEEKGLLPISGFAPHRITLDGVIRCNNDGCPSAEEVLDILTNVKFITDEHNGLYDLFGLSEGDFFTIKGRIYEGFSSTDNLRELMAVCEDNTGLIYDLINNPEKIQVVESLDNNPTKRITAKNALQ